MGLVWAGISPRPTFFDVAVDGASAGPGWRGREQAAYCAFHVVDADHAIPSLKRGFSHGGMFHGISQQSWYHGTKVLFRLLYVRTAQRGYCFGRQFV